MSCESVYERAICRKQNSGELTRNPSPASRNELSGMLVQVWLTTRFVSVRVKGSPTIVSIGREHPAGRRLLSPSRGFSASARTSRAWCVASRRARCPRMNPGPTSRQYASAELYPTRMFIIVHYRKSGRNSMVGEFRSMRIRQESWYVPHFPSSAVFYFSE